jgi:hypothetical protein
VHADIFFFEHIIGEGRVSKIIEMILAFLMNSTLSNFLWKCRKPPKLDNFLALMRDFDSHECKFYIYESENDTYELWGHLKLDVKKL